MSAGRERLGMTAAVPSSRHVAAAAEVEDDTEATIQRRREAELDAGRPARRHAVPPPVARPRR